MERWVLRIKLDKSLSGKKEKKKKEREREKGGKEGRLSWNNCIAQSTPLGLETAIDNEVRSSGISQRKSVPCGS